MPKRSRFAEFVGIPDKNYATFCLEMGQFWFCFQGFPVFGCSDFGISLYCNCIANYFFHRMIQTRGRARQQGSRYIILADEAQHNMQERIKAQEELLDIVIGSNQFGPSQKVIILSTVEGFLI